jgi:hypothetical protein
MPDGKVMHVWHPFGMQRFVATHPVAALRLPPANFCDRFAVIGASGGGAALATG